MIKVRLFIPLLSLLFNSHSAVAAGTVITLDDFRAGISPHWQEKVFKGHTLYQATVKDDQPCIAATADASASGLVYELKFDPHATPILTWQWQVDHTLATADATKKSGDDYPARVYVVFPSPLFWRTRALNYVWDNHLPKETVLANAYTANAMMIVVESGPAATGKWLTERRDLEADFRKAFGEPPPQAGAIAIMTDTDDTGESARAWYGPITLSPAAPEGPRQPTKMVEISTRSE